MNKTKFGYLKNKHITGVLELNDKMDEIKALMDKWSYWTVVDLFYWTNGQIKLFENNPNYRLKLYVKVNGKKKRIGSKITLDTIKLIKDISTDVMDEGVDKRYDQL
jgi:hypothetical protein